MIINIYKPRPETRPEIFKMVKWVAAKLEHLGATTELKDVGKQV